MKVGDFSNTDIEGDDFDSIDAGVDESNLGFMFDIVSNQMYRRPINSIVREITSNCFDSHIEANVTDPVIIKISHDETGDYIAFQDFGVGISPERMNKVYAKYFSSTKRDTNDQIGMFGLGSKSPLSYSDSFYVTTVFDKIKYEYMVHKGVKKPQIVPLIQTKVEDRNQTEVRVYIKNSSDLFKFIDACKTELVYFDNVYVDTIYSTFINQYRILDYTTFKFRETQQYSNELHICIGKVAYPISWQELGIPRISVPCGLKFNIGDLQVTPERESIRYIEFITPEGTVSTKDIILKKIEDFKAEIIELYKEQSTSEFEDFQEYLQYLQNAKAVIKLGNVSVDISSIVPKVEPVFVPLRGYIGKLPSNIFYSWRADFFYRKGNKVRPIDKQVNYELLNDSVCIVVPDGRKLNQKKLQYLYDFAYNLVGKYEFYTVYNKHERLNISTEEVLRTKLAVYHLDRSSASYNYLDTNKTAQYNMIESFIRQEFNRLSFNYDDIDIPQEWLNAYAAARKAARNTVKVDGSFLVYDYGKLLISDAKTYVTAKDLEKFKGFLIYGFEEDEELLRNFRSLLSYTKYGVQPKDKYDFRTFCIHPFKCRIYKTAQRNEKYLVQFKNAIHVYDFMGNNKVFKRIATAAFIHEHSKAIGVKGYSVGLDANTRAKCYRFDDFMENVFPPYADAIRDIEDACRDYGTVSYTRANSEVTDKFYQELLKIAEEYKLFDPVMLDLHQKLEGYVAGLELVNYIALHKESVPYVVEFLLLKSKRVDSIWLNPTKYEQELLKEIEAKATYLKEVHSMGRSRTSNRSMTIVNQCESIINWNKALTIIYEKYNQSKQAA